MRKGLFAVLFLALTPLLPAQQAMTNDTVIKMVKAGLSDDVIVTTINSSTGTYDTSADGLIALKTAGASDKVIAAIVAKGSPSAVPVAAPAPIPPPPPPLPAGVDEVGAYYKDSGGNYQPLPNEAVVFQSGGLVKHIASATLIKQDLNGFIGGTRSRLVVSTPVSFILHVAPGKTPNDYQLLRLHVSGNNRQFQSVSGGLEHETSGAVHDFVDYSSRQVGADAYQVVLDSGVGAGEYGFLAPQDTPSSGGAPSSGKIYTFAIVN